MKVCFHCGMNIEDVTYDKVISHFGSAAAMARALEIKPQAVYQWAGRIPQLRKYELLDLMNPASRLPSGFQDEVA